MPPVDDDGAWDFVANVREAVRRIMVDKAPGAFAVVSPHLSTPPTRLQLGAFRRDVVRRYNGGREIRWNGAAFECFPVTQVANLGYCNSVLGTAVAYAGVSAAVPFTLADVGPGI
jgi:hypothetical protein